MLLLNGLGGFGAATGAIAPSPSAAAVALGASVVLTESVNFAPSKTWPSAHQPASPDQLAMLMGRCNGASAAIASLSLGSSAFTPIEGAAAFGGNGGNALAWAGTLQGVATGSPLDVTLTGTALGKIVLFLVDLIDWSGSFGGVDADQTETPATTSIALSLLRAGTGKRIVAIGGGVWGLLEPLAAAGFERIGQAKTGPGEGQSVAAGLFTAIGGAAGGSESITIESSTATQHWGGAMVELL